MPRLAIQLYTLRSLDEPLPALLDRIADLGYDGVEFAYRVQETPTDEVRAALDRTDLAVAAAHVPIESLAVEYDATVALYTQLDCDTLVIPWIDPDRFETVGRIATVAERLNELAADLAADGISLAYHHHDHELVALESADHARWTALDELLDRTDDRIGLEVDLGWALVGGVDPGLLLDRYGDRITHIHVSDADVVAGEPVGLGEGDLDLDALADALHRVDADWWVYEHDDPDDPIASITAGIDGLQRHVGR
ncbi:sugar phosphate isomerase/epimerase family protein [Halorubrum vacuolatum]|uniref:Sugar phosphate isomerase/epimerase n=1 Tax=Halorubrum vacuolatum TaxID=63740 RepID=A0A238VUW0_HALVU|nr:sugar phosphate isomerase/epimerase [Halorubrum vacuolatum]SNR37971.1 Sugar phosphate isomerase/epimerase [Halorubrum vacuolatum]